MIISLIADFMKNTVVTAIFLTSLSIFNLSGQDNKKVMDWANLSRYKEANIALLKENPSSSTIVLMGNSITEGWVRERPDFFKAHTNIVGRGISGQTTPQMLLRFKQDVVHLKPKLVVLLCGINDIAQNTGPISQSEIMDNIISMCELAVANKIGVILSSVLPASDFPWRPGMNPGPKVVSLNEDIKKYAKLKGHVYLDYYSSMEDGNLGLRPGLSTDKVHPTPAGYAIMEPLLLAAIQKGLKKL
jgi:lysophospholipase L1-like esterase